MKPLSNKDIGKILKLKKIFINKKEFTENASSIHVDTGTIAMNLVSTLDSVEFMPVFDYMQWLKSMDHYNSPQSYISDVNVLKDADLNTIRKIMTANIRIDRFSEGYLEELIENGYINALLERIEELSKE